MIGILIGIGVAGIIAVLLYEYAYWRGVTLAYDVMEDLFAEAGALPVLDSVLDKGLQKLPVKARRKVGR